MVKLPPASPFDNFLKAAYRTQQEMWSALGDHS
jgi:hypothetical protein